MVIQALPYFILHLTVFSRANKLYGFPDPSQDPLVKNILEAGVRISAKPITPEMISSIC